jgi:hypothetical protein
MDKVEDRIYPHSKIGAPILNPHTVHSKISCPKKRPYPSLKDMARDMEFHYGKRIALISAFKALDEVTFVATV